MNETVKGERKKKTEDRPLWNTYIQTTKEGRNKDIKKGIFSQSQYWGISRKLGELTAPNVGQIKNDDFLKIYEI